MNVQSSITSVQSGLKTAKQIGHFVNAFFDVVSYASERLDEINYPKEKKVVETLEPKEDANEGNTK